MKRILLLVSSMLVLLMMQLATTIPIAIAFFLGFFIARKNVSVCILAAIVGVILDVFFISRIGTTSLFLQVCFFLILLYERKFEIQTVPFVLMCCFVSSLIYVSITGSNFAILEAIASSILAIIVFKVLSWNRKGAKLDYEDRSDVW